MDVTCNYIYVFTWFWMQLFIHLMLDYFFIDNGEYDIISSEWGVLENTQV